MKQSNNMAKVIIGLANKHGFDLPAPFGHLRLTNGSWQPLVIEKHGPNTVAVMHIASDGYLDPMIRFQVFPAQPEPSWKAYTDWKWFPTDIRQAFGTCDTRILAYQEDDSWHYAPSQQADAAQFANTWAKNIREQKWLENAEADTLWAAASNKAYSIETTGRIAQMPDPAPEGYTLKQLQEAVDGYIEVVYTAATSHILIVNEEGKLGDHDINEIATRLSCVDRFGDYVAGAAVLMPNAWLK